MLTHRDWIFELERFRFSHFIFGWKKHNILGFENLIVQELQVIITLECFLTIVFAGMNHHFCKELSNSF